MTGSRPRATPRSGMVSVWVLIVLAIVTSLSAAALLQMSHVRKQVDGGRNRAQAEWLARSGYELAVGRLMTNPDGSTGETVTLVPEGEVAITVRKHPRKKDVFQVECEARYQPAPNRIVVRIRRAVHRQEGPDGVRAETVPDEP